MTRFKDKNDKEWRIEITMGTIKTVRELLCIDLMESIKKDGESNLSFELMLNPEMLVDILFVVCMDQADAEKITDIQFAALMGGDAIELATEALLGEIVNFSPKLLRKPMMAAMAKSMEIMEAGAKHVTDRMASVNVQKILDKNKASLDKHISSLESAELTPET